MNDNARYRELKVFLSQHLYPIYAVFEGVKLLY